MNIGTTRKDFGAIEQSFGSIEINIGATRKDFDLSEIYNFVIV